MTLVLGTGFGVIVVLGFFVSLLYRRMVPPNEVHIVQTRKNTVSYGKGYARGNTYYEWPSWLPLIGVTKTVLPVSNFDVDLDSYEAYDKGRLPFVVDVKAFFRISDSNVAAQRVSSFQELYSQLKAIVQGAVRTILASSEIEEIMQGRSKFGDEFTKEVSDQLQHWGVEAVKNIELMDIRDSQSSHVIRNIMEKKKSHIEMESRTEVARNKKAAEIAEIEAEREVDLQKQEALQTVGLRTVETNRQVELAKQTANQAVKEQEKTTKEKEMAVLMVQNLRAAEIEREVQLVKAQQNKDTAVLIADGQLEAKRREAQGITAEGEARAAAEKAMQLAPVEAQIVLAREIGNNENYQNYLVTVRKVEAAQAVGIAQADALQKANIKVIANSGTPGEGLTNVMDLFSSNGGTKVGAMLEALANTESGEALMKKLNLTNTNNSNDTNQTA